jgi:bifunctional non-homologous end joining protein LigD
MSLSFPVAPMKAAMGNVPADGDEPAWAFEIKWDGHRTLAHVGGGRARLQSTAGHDVSERWAEVVDLGSAVNATSAIIDGEMLVIGADGRPSFDLIQRGGTREHPAVFHAFDVLAIGGTDTISLPYRDRRRLLSELVEDDDHWSVPSHRVGGGADLLAATVEQGLEGIIAKRLDAPYQPGRRSKDWLKIKNRRRVAVPVGGFTSGTGNRASTFGALLIGHPDSPTGGPLRFAGGVGTGFTQSVLEELREKLAGLTTSACPFDPPPPTTAMRNATWVEPRLHALIEIAEFTNDGYARHASFVGLVEPGS